MSISNICNGISFEYKKFFTNSIFVQLNLHFIPLCDTHWVDVAFFAITWHQGDKNAQLNTTYFEVLGAAMWDGRHSLQRSRSYFFRSSNNGYTAPREDIVSLIPRPRKCQKQNLKIHPHYAVWHTATQCSKAAQQKLHHAASICGHCIGSAAACHLMLHGLKILSANRWSHQRKPRDIDATPARQHSFQWY